MSVHVIFDIIIMVIYMFNKIKSLFIKEKTSLEKKHVIVCIHGFGIRTTHQFDNFMLWNNNDFNLYTFPIFVMENEDDCNPKVWITRCESVVENFINAGYEVDLLGFSMGGVLASHVASKYKIGRLFLIAPAFEYMTPNNVLNKTKEILKIKENINQPTLPSTFTPCFIEVIKMCKESIKKVKCPVCIVHGNNDETIPYKSSINIIEQIPHDQKRLFIINKGTHHLMSDKISGFETFLLFKNFMDKKILPEEKVIYCKDIYE